MQFGGSQGHFFTCLLTIENDAKVVFATPLRKYWHFWRVAGHGGWRWCMGGVGESVRFLRKYEGFGVVWLRGWNFGCCCLPGEALLICVISNGI